MLDFKCPICLRESESNKAHKTFQLYGTETKHIICDSCADIVTMLRGGSAKDSEVLIIRLSVFHRALLARFAPFWGKNDAEVIKALAMRWIEENIVTDKVMFLSGLNEMVKDEMERSTTNPKEDVVVAENIPEATPQHDVATNGFVFRDCKEYCVVTDSFPPITHGKTTYYLKKEKENYMVRIERMRYPCAAHAYLTDVLYLYDHPKEVRKLLKHIDYNRRPIIRGFLKDVPVESLHLVKPEIKKECFEKDCVNKSPEQCPFCTNKSRYETAKMKKRRELRQLAINMGVT